MTKPNPACIPCAGNGYIVTGRREKTCAACAGSGRATICDDCLGVITLSEHDPFFISVRLHILGSCPWTQTLKDAGEWKSPSWEAAIQRYLATSSHA